MTDDNSVKADLGNGTGAGIGPGLNGYLMRAVLVSDDFRKDNEGEAMFSTPACRRAVTYMPSLYHSLV
jgi:hypothetical protein